MSSNEYNYNKENSGSKIGASIKIRQNRIKTFQKKNFFSNSQNNLKKALTPKINILIFNIIKF